MLLGTKSSPRGWASAAALIVLLTALASSFSTATMNSECNFPSTVDMDCRVVASRPWGRRTALLLSTPCGRAAAYVPTESAPREGAYAHVRAAVFEFKRADKKGGFDEFLFWRGRRALRKLVVLEMRETAPPSGIGKWRGLLSQRIRDTLPERMAGYMLALTTGERDKELMDLHKSTGTSHLLAVSGFHVCIAVALASFLFRGCGTAGVLAISAFMWFYVLFAGLPVGGIRAAFMTQVYLAGRIIGRGRNSFNSVSAAGVLMLIMNPWSFYDVGWRLSMLAALFLTSLSRIAPISRVFAALSSLLVWIVTAPQVIMSFKKAPAVGILINALALPLFAVLFPAMLALSVPSLLGIQGGWLFASVGEYFLEAWEIFSRIAVAVVPWNITNGAILLPLSAAIFGAAAAYASHYPVRRLPAVAVLCPLAALFFL